MLGLIVRFVVSALVLLFTSFLVPGFRVANFWSALLAAIAIAVVGYAVEALFGKRASPQSRGIVGFLSGAVVLWLVSALMPGAIQVTLIGALLASLVIGIIDAFVPTELR